MFNSLSMTTLTLYLLVTLMSKRMEAGLYLTMVHSRILEIGKFITQLSQSKTPLKDVDAGMQNKSMAGYISMEIDYSLSAYTSAVMRETNCRMMLV